MWTIIINVFIFIGTVVTIFLSGIAKGASNEKQKQLKQENENTNENLRINKKANDMSFDDRHDFLFGKQKNNNS